MEEEERELAAMATYLRRHDPSVAAQIAGMQIDPDADRAKVESNILHQLASAWKHSLRRKPEYLAWRRETEPDYHAPDEPDPKAWENQTDVQKFERRRGQVNMARFADRVAAMTPEQQRVYAHIHHEHQKMFAVMARINAIGNGGDDRTRELAEAMTDGLAILLDMVRTIADNGATIDLADS